ncbi:MAG TPA: TonB-dependent receptor [Acidobacteriota bacterium]|nr:TonB-dependent receptor [Acidobacteriota bacterium]
MKARTALLTICSLTVIVLVAPASSRALDETVTPDTADVYELETVVRVKGAAIHSPVVVTELTPEDIGRRNVVTVADVLRNEPGLSITRGGSKAETQTRIRGLPARDVLVLVDGRPVNPGYYGKVDLSMLSVDNVARIRVTRGPASVAYGANGMAGVINIVTSNGLEKPRTVVRTELGDYQYRKLTVNHSRRAGRFNYWISGYEDHSRGYVLSGDFEPNSLEDGGLRDYSFYHMLGVSTKLGYQPAESSLYSLSLGYHWARRDISPSVHPSTAAPLRYFPDWQRFNGAVSAHWTVSPAAELKSVIFVDAQHDRLIEYTGSEKREDRIAWDSRLENWTVGARMDAKLRSWRKHEVHAGLDVKRDLMNKKPDVDEPWISCHTYLGTVFLQDIYLPWDNTEITLGSGYSLFANQDTSLTDMVYTGRLSCMAGLVQRLPAGLEGHAGYARAVRFPTLHHLYSESSGNDSLKAEQADKYEIGLRSRFGMGQKDRYCMLSLAWFHNDVKNLIDRASRTFRFRNIGRARSQGWEMWVHGQFSRRLSGGVSWAHLLKAETSDELLDELSPNKVRFYVSVEAASGTELNYERTYFDERTTFDAYVMLPDYVVHNVNVTQTLRYSLKLRLAVSNVTDACYEEELGYPAPGRQVTVGLIWGD